MTLKMETKADMTALSERYTSSSARGRRAKRRECLFWIPGCWDGEEGRGWYHDHDDSTSLRVMWDTCPRGEWLLWLIRILAKEGHLGLRRDRVLELFAIAGKRPGNGVRMGIKRLVDGRVPADEIRARFGFDEVHRALLGLARCAPEKPYTWRPGAAA